MPLEELEIHLREEIERQVKSGLNEQEAFNFATQKIGQSSVLKSEFKKIGGTISECLKHFLFTLSGIPNYQLVTNMNRTNPNIEPRWVTYTKAGTFLFPAVFLWLLTVVFVLPKANEICSVAGTTVFNFAQPIPAILRVWAATSQTLVFLTSHGFLIGVAIVLAFILLERYFSRWSRYRRTAVGIVAFLFNAVVLLSLTLMTISILVAAPALYHHAH
ncbi:MAG TPA: hypothetical protein VHG71_13165 [Verrucomicrobiae bacterium]|nr:hypothetical protein [Verrucomicrobiae bacterium]